MGTGSRTKRPVTQSLKAMTFTLAPRPMTATPALFGFVALDLSDTERYFGIGETKSYAVYSAMSYHNDCLALDVLPTTVRFAMAAAAEGDMMPASAWHVTRIDGRQIADLRA
jgi:hypothetical protein